MGKGKKKHSKDGRNDDRMKRKDYEAELRKLHVKLCHLQEWVKKKGLRVIIAFEGRDAEGKGGGRSEDAWTGSDCWANAGYALKAANATPHSTNTP